MARRRRDLSRSSRFFRSLSCFYELFLSVFWLFKPVYPVISNPRPLLIPLFDVATFDIATTWFPASHLRPLLNPRGPKTTYDEVFVSTCAIYVKSEICLLLPAGSKIFSGALRRNFGKTSATNLFSGLKPSWNVTMLPTLSPEMTDSSSIIAPPPFSRHNAIVICPSKGNLGFLLLGLSFIFGPPSKSWPTTKRTGPFPSNKWPRYAPLICLSNSSRSQHRLSNVSDRRHRLRRKASSLLLSCVHHIGSLWLHSTMALFSASNLLMISDRLGDFCHQTPIPDYENLHSCREATNCIWCCEYLSRTLLSRFDWNPTLHHPSQSQYSFMKPSVRRLHLDNKLLLVLGWLESFLDNMLLESSRTLAFEASNLNDLDIMIQSIRNCGYRYVFMLPSSNRLIHKPFKLSLINFLKFPLKNLKTSGIMIPIQCSGGYHNISKRFKPEPKTTTTLITIFKQSIINRVQTLGKALLRVDILNPVTSLALAFSTLRSLRCKTVAIFSSIEVFMEEASIFLDLTGSKTLARSWFIALKSTISMTLIYLYLFVVLALGIALPCCFLNFDLYVVCCVLF